MRTNSSSKSAMPARSNGAQRYRSKPSRMMKKRTPSALFHAARLSANSGCGSARCGALLRSASQICDRSAASGAFSHRSKTIATSGPRSIALFSDWRSGDGAIAPVWSCARRSSARPRSNGKTPVFSNVVLPAPSAPYSTVRRERRKTSTSICASNSRERQAESCLTLESSTAWIVVPGCGDPLTKSGGESSILRLSSTVR